VVSAGEVVVLGLVETSAPSVALVAIAVVPVVAVGPVDVEASLVAEVVVSLPGSPATHASKNVLDSARIDRRRAILSGQYHASSILVLSMPPFADFTHPVRSATMSRGPVDVSELATPHPIPTNRDAGPPRASPRPRRGLVLLGCDEHEDSPYANEAVAACVADNHPDDGHDWESDQGPCASGPPGSPPQECPPPTPQSVTDECTAAGVSCDPDAFITRDAALCVAEAEGLAEGLAAWTAELRFSARLERPIWSVANTTAGAPNSCFQESTVMAIDAETGEVLEQSNLMVIC
jgi:hypothetical protein